MAISARIGLKQTQRTALSQQIIQSINLLQLSNMELSEKISAELQENPLLEEERLIKSPASDAADRDSGMISDVTKELSGDDSVFQRSEEKEIIYENYSDNNYSESSEEDRKRSFIENAITQEETLKEHLSAQARLITEDGTELTILDYIISSLDDNGFLQVNKEEIAKVNRVTADKIEEALNVLRELDPVGCGAKDVHETLIIQAEIFHPEDELLQKIIRHHFLDLEKMQYDRIEKALNIKTPEIIEKNRLIQQMSPFPGRDFGTKGIKYIIPDIEVKLVDDEIVITLNDDWIPGIRINSYYSGILKKKNIDKKLKQYLKDKMQSAKYLIDSISNRRETIIRVVKAVMEHQRDFLIKGTGNLKPLVYADIAKTIEMHESTVSRVANNKYVQTSWGIFELKSFFVSKLKSDNEKNCSSDEVLNLIKNFVNSEDPLKPLTDEEIVAKLKKKNINAARRTIAKYRGILHIPPSNMRKKINIYKKNEEVPG